MTGELVGALADQLRIHLLAQFFVLDALMQNLPSEAAPPVRQSADRFARSQPRQQPAVQPLEDAALGPGRCLRYLSQDTPHLPFPFGQRLDLELQPTPAAGWRSDACEVRRQCFDPAAPSLITHDTAVVAAQLVASVYGNEFASDLIRPADGPVSFELGGVRLTLLDAKGVRRVAPLYFVSPGQINLVVPDAAPGPARIEILKDAATAWAGAIEIATVAPGLFPPMAMEKASPPQSS